MAESEALHQFIEDLGSKVDRARLSKSLKMLRADRFQLFVDVDDEHVVGVVKSQTDASLTYACRLTNHGEFSCCTQRLHLCGGLRNKVCKHILVLVVGLVQAGTLSAAQALTWIQASRSNPHTMDAEGAAALFVRYKGAEAGEVDWRPTETLPEDFYAL